MKKVVGVIAGVWLATMAGETLAGGYFGAGFSRMTYEESDVSAEADPTALFLRGGWRFNDYLAAEARLGAGVSDDSVHVMGVSVDVEVDYFVGGYLKAGLPVGNLLYPYVVVGATKAELTASAGGFDFSDDATDVSYGAGVDFRFNERLSAGVEYMNYIDKDGGELSGISIGLDISF